MIRIEGEEKPMKHCNMYFAKGFNFETTAGLLGYKSKIKFLQNKFYSIYNNIDFEIIVINFHLGTLTANNQSCWQYESDGNLFPEHTVQEEIEKRGQQIFLIIQVRILPKISDDRT